MARSPFDVSDILLQGGNMGQLLGRGIEQAASGLSQGIQQYALNKQMAARDIAEFEGAVQNNPRLLQAVQGDNTSKEVSSAFKKLQGGGVGSKDAAILSSFARSFTANEAQARAAQLQQLQIQQFQQAEQNKAKVMQNIAMMNQFGGTGGAGVLNPQAMAQVKAMQANPMMQMQSQIMGATGQLAAPKDLMDYAQAQATMKKPQGQFMTAAEFNAYKEQNKGMDIKAVPVDGGVMVTGLGTYAPKADTNVSVNAGESAYRKTLGEEAAKSQMELYKSAKVATKTLPKLNETLKLIETGDVSTGVFADVEKNINRVKAKFLNDAKAGKAVSDTEYLDALLGSDVFPMIGELGIGARGLDTPAEREFLRSVMTGSIPLNKETIKKLTLMRRDVQLRAIGEYNNQVDSGELNDFFEATKFRKKKFDLPGSSAPAAQTPITVDY